LVCEVWTGCFPPVELLRELVGEGVLGGWIAVPDGTGLPDGAFVAWGVAATGAEPDSGGADEPVTGETGEAATGVGVEPVRVWVHVWAPPWRG
jgi:hypothetical protein